MGKRILKKDIVAVSKKMSSLTEFYQNNEPKLTDPAAMFLVKIVIQSLEELKRYSSKIDTSKIVTVQKGEVVPEEVPYLAKEWDSKAQKYRLRRK